MLFDCSLCVHHFVVFFCIAAFLIFVYTANIRCTESRLKCADNYGQSADNYGRYCLKKRLYPLFPRPWMACGRMGTRYRRAGAAHPPPGKLNPRPGMHHPPSGMSHPCTRLGFPLWVMAYIRPLKRYWCLDLSLHRRERQLSGQGCVDRSHGWCSRHRWRAVHEPGKANREGGLRIHERRQVNPAR